MSLIQDYADWRCNKSICQVWRNDGPPFKVSHQLFIAYCSLWSKYYKPILVHGLSWQMNASECKYATSKKTKDVKELWNSEHL